MADTEDLLEMNAALSADNAALGAENAALSRAAGTILRCSKYPLDTCPHGNRPSYPSHAWWCDACFGALEDALLSPQAACPRCGEPADGLFNARTDYNSEQGPFCNSCGWPERLQAAESPEVSVTVDGMLPGYRVKKGG